MSSILSIGSRRTEPSESAAGLLLACHGRIRNFVALAERLARADTASAEEIAETARSVHRYFAVAMVLHVEDEDRSVTPRLLASPAASTLVEPLERMTQQHEETERILDRLRPVWQRLACEPDRTDERRATRADAAALSSLLLDHLALEEATVLPAIDRVLAPAEQARLAEEIRARRASQLAAK